MKIYCFLDQDENIRSSLNIDVINRPENAFKYIKDYDTAILELRGSTIHLAVLYFIMVDPKYFH